MPFILHACIVLDHVTPCTVVHALHACNVCGVYTKDAPVVLCIPSGRTHIEWTSTAQAQMYPQAATCYEELLMHQPASAATHIQYADVLYTIGGSANYQTARTHYSSAIDISSGRNLRALYGLCATSAQLKKESSRVTHLHTFPRPNLHCLGLEQQEECNT